MPMFPLKMGFPSGGAFKIHLQEYLVYWGYLRLRPHNLRTSPFHRKDPQKTPASFRIVKGPQGFWLCKATRLRRGDTIWAGVSAAIFCQLSYLELLQLK